MIFDYTRDKAASSITPGSWIWKGTSLPPGGVEAYESEKVQGDRCPARKSDANLKYFGEASGEETYFFDFSSSCTSEAITGFNSSRVTACITSGLSFDNTLATIASTSVCVAVGCVEATSAADKSEITVASSSEEAAPVPPDGPHSLFVAVPAVSASSVVAAFSESNAAAHGLDLFASLSQGLAGLENQLLTGSGSASFALCRAI